MALVISGFAIPAGRVMSDSKVTPDPAGYACPPLTLTPKILGCAAFGQDSTPFMGVPSSNVALGQFVITNPSCTDNISLSTMQVIRGYDEALIYRGPAIQVLGTTRYSISKLLPHQIMVVDLSSCFPVPAYSPCGAQAQWPAMWLDFGAGAPLPGLCIYTLEIKYTSPATAPTLKPVGASMTRQIHKYNDGTFVGIDSSTTSTEMKTYP
jgi:hypothetical protein